MQGICDVCRILDGDDSPKLVQFCSLCQAWMCDDCRKNVIRRTQAMAMRAMGWEKQARGHRP